MRGRKKCLLWILNKNGVNCSAFHCVIHQQALFSKEIGMDSIAVKIINKIRGGHNALIHTYAEYGDLLFYTEIRWLRNNIHTTQ